MRLLNKRLYIFMYETLYIVYNETDVLKLKCHIPNSTEMLAATDIP
jgi:hypothetical protein